MDQLLPGAVPVHYVLEKQNRIPSLLGKEVGTPQPKRWAGLAMLAPWSGPELPAPPSTSAPPWPGALTQL